MFMYSIPCKKNRSEVQPQYILHKKNFRIKMQDLQLKCQYKSSLHLQLNAIFASKNKKNLQISTKIGLLKLKVTYNVQCMSKNAILKKSNLHCTE